MTAALPLVDHLVFAAPDLDAGVDVVRDLMGLEPVRGGVHPGFGTRNALVSLGSSTYLEIIGPDPDRGYDELPGIFTIDRIDRPRLVTWAMRGTRLDGIVSAVAAAGVDLGDVSIGARTTPDGTALSWRLTDPYTDRLGGVVPFLIDWGDSTHPTGALPSGGTLTSLTIGHPNPETVEPVFHALETAVVVEHASHPQVTATIDTPHGTVRLQ